MASQKPPSDRFFRGLLKTRFSKSPLFLAGRFWAWSVLAGVFMGSLIFLGTSLGALSSAASDTELSARRSEEAETQARGSEAIPRAAPDGETQDGDPRKGEARKDQKGKSEAIASAQNIPAAFIILKALAPETSEDGSVRQAFEAMPSEGGISGDARFAEAFYRFEPLFGPLAGDEKWMKAALDPKSPRLVLKSGTGVKASVLISLQTSRGQNTARMVARLFGRGQGRPSGPGIETAAPDLPFLDLEGSPPYPRLGEELRVKLENPPPGAPLCLWAIDGDSGKAEFVETPPYRHLPPPDRELSRRGYNAVKSLYLVKPLQGGSSASLTVWLARSDGTYWNEAKGAAILAGFALFGGAIGRRFNKPGSQPKSRG